MTHPEPTRLVAASDMPRVPLEVVDIRTELETRLPRSPNLVREHRAFPMLATEMAANPHNLLQTLVELALELCDAHTSGISLLDGDVFRWEVIPGVFAAERGGTIPRNESPCGICLDRNTTQLLYLADRCFPLLSAEPRMIEALLIPFHADGKAIGTSVDCQPRGRSKVRSRG
jgi:hypothetical protein